MKFLHPLFVEIIDALLKHQVDFLLIGGYAVNYHGYGRPTGDLDIWLRPDNTTKEKTLKAFSDLKFKMDDIENIRIQNFEKALVFFHGEVPLRIDFLTQVNSVNFDDAWEKRKIFKLKEIQIPIVDYDFLILTKISTGRTKDKLDLEELQKVNQVKNKK